MTFEYVFYLWEIFKSFIIFGHANVTRLTSFHHEREPKISKHMKSIFHSPSTYIFIIFRPTLEYE